MQFIKEHAERIIRRFGIRYHPHLVAPKPDHRALCRPLLSVAAWRCRPLRASNLPPGQPRPPVAQFWQQHPGPPFLLPPQGWYAEQLGSPGTVAGHPRPGAGLPAAKTAGVKGTGHDFLLFILSKEKNRIFNWSTDIYAHTIPCLCQP